MTNKTKTILLIILGILLASLIFVLSFTGKTVNKESSTIKIGLTLPLSGSYSYIGQADFNGLQMAADEINAKGGINGHKIQIIAEDNKGDAKEAVTNVNKLLSVDNTPIVFSSFTHITNAIKGTVFDNNKILFYQSTVSGIAKENKYAFRDYFDATDAGKAIAQAVVNSGYKRVYFLTEVSDQCKEYESSFNKEASKLGIQVIAREEYVTTSTSLKTQITKLDPKEGNALVTCTWRHSQILMKEMKELGLIKVQTFQWVGHFFPVADTQEIRQLYEENNAVDAWYGFAEVSDKESQKIFIEKYQAKFGSMPPANAAYAYDDMNVLASALKKCNADTENKDCIASQLSKTNHDGVGGNLQFNQDRASQRPVIPVKVVNGQWQEVKF